MSSTIIFTFCLLFTVLESVFGATCTNSATCVVSTHTTGACDSTTKVCTCDSSSAAIRTGCGSKLSTPTLTQPSGYSTVVLEGKSATLTCSSPEGATLFEWTFKGSVINGVTAKTYTIAAASSSDVGIYNCKAKVSENSNLDSDLSNDLQIDIFLKTDTTISNGPTVYLPTSTVFDGKSVTVSCINIPMGYDPAKVIITNATSTITSPLTMVSSNKGKPVKCELTDTPTSHVNKITGSTTNLPTFIYYLSQSPTISTSAVNNGVYTKDASISFNCDTSPKVDYLDTERIPITWSWLRDTTVISGANTQTYELQQEEGSYTIKCQTETPSGTSMSLPITIVRNSSYVTKPVIIADTTTPVVGSRLTLACGSAVDGATYSWKKDSTDIARQLEHIIQLDNLTISDHGAYECTVQRSMVIQTSESFTVNVIDLTKPVIIANPTTPVLGSDLSLECGSTVDGVTYSWKKGNRDIGRPFEQILQLKNLTTCDNGAYQCTVELNMFNRTSDSFTFYVGDLTKPVIIADPTTPVLGSRLSLACGSAVDGAMYSWKKNNTDIASQLAQILQINNVTNSDNGAYQCTVKRGMANQTSDSFTFYVGDLTKPNIIADPTTPVLGSRLSLTCGSTVDGATYSWKKDNTYIGRHFERILHLNNVTTSENGAYYCTVERSMADQTSDSFTVNVSSGQEIVKVSMFVLGLTLLMSKVFA